jgi:hypothetical protein
LYVANSARFDRSGAIAVYPPGAVGDDKPVRVLAGPDTKLQEPRDIEFDSQGNMYTFNQGPELVSVFRAQASGNEAPLRTIGRRTGGPVALAVGRADTLYALNAFGYGRRCDPVEPGDSATVTAYAPGAGADDPPVRSLVLTQDGTCPWSPRPFNLLRDLAVDTRGALQVWYPEGAAWYPPGARGRGDATAQFIVETPVPGSEALGVAVTSDGWVYQTNLPSAGSCK